MELNPIQARKLILNNQGLVSQNKVGNGVSATLGAIKQLSYIQIDTISVVERAHHHTLWNRVDNYSLDHLSELQQQGEIFEYWSHAAAYLPMQDYRFSLPRKHSYSSGEQHWHKFDKKIVKQVLKRIKEEGPLQAKDFEHHKKVGDKGWWEWKPAKIALEQLFMEGKLMVAKRNGFQKVYDLSERVIPENIDVSMPSREDHYQHLIHSYLKCNVIATPAQISYLRKGLKPLIVQQCLKMKDQGELVNVEFNGQSYYALSNIDELLKISYNNNAVKILSPFDNLLIQRKRVLELFDFDYQIECYVPAAKRKYGYFSLPLLWGSEFAGRMDAKIDRKTKIFHIYHLHIETEKIDEFIHAFKPSLESFTLFNLSNQKEIHQITSKFKQYSKSTLKQLRKSLLN